MRIANRSMLLRRYLMSYFSLAFLSCTLAGALISWIAVSEMSRQSEARMRTETQIVLDDLEAQHDIMYEVAHRIQNTISYQPFYKNRSPYYHIELIRDMAKYAGYTRLSEQMFLLYQSEDNVYTEGSVCGWDVYCRYRLFASDPAALRRELEAETAEPMRCLIGETRASGGAWTLWAYQIHFTGKYDPRGDAVVCFVVTEDALIRRVGELTDLDEETLRLQYADTRLAGAPQAPEDALTLRAKDSAFRVSAWSASDSLGAFQRLCLYLVLGLAAVFIAAAAILAYASYRPIRRLAESVRCEGADGAKGELDQIARAVDRLFADNQSSEKRIREQLATLTAQRGVIRAQVLRLLLGGVPFSDVVSCAQAGVRLDSPVHCVFYVALEGKRCDLRALLPAIEELSDDALRLYAVELSQNSGFALLAGMQEEGGAEDVKALVSSLMDAYGVTDARVGVGFPCGDRSLLPASFLAAITGAHEPARRTRDAEALCEIAASLRRGDADDAIARARSFVRASAPPIARERLIALMETIDEASGASPADVKMRSVAMVGDAEAFMRDLPEYVFSVCQAAREQFGQRESALGGQICAYLDEHALDYNLSLATVADAFSLSGKQVGRLIQRHTNQSFKEYVTGKKLEAAVAFLTEERLTVMETSERLGFTVTYFIKMFRKHMGYTPASYRQRGGGDAAGK